MASKATTEAAEQIDLIIKSAPALAAAGVTKLSLGDLSVELAAPTPEIPKADEDEKSPPAAHIDPMQDPASYQGGVVPGFKRPK